MAIRILGKWRNSPPAGHVNWEAKPGRQSSHLCRWRDKAGCRCRSVSAPIQALMVQVSAFSASAGPFGLCRLGKSVSPVFFFFFFALDSEVVITLEMSMCFLLKRGGKKAEGRKKKFNLSGWRKYKLHLILPFPFNPPTKIKRETTLSGEWRML